MVDYNEAKFKLMLEIAERFGEQWGNRVKELGVLLSDLTKNLNYFVIFTFFYLFFLLFLTIYRLLFSN